MYFFVFNVNRTPRQNPPSALYSVPCRSGAIPRMFSFMRVSPKLMETSALCAKAAAGQTPARMTTDHNLIDVASGNPLILIPAGCGAKVNDFAVHSLLDRRSVGHEGST